MGVRMLLKSNKLNVYSAKDNKDFIEFIAERAVNYSVQPEVNDFCDEHPKPEELYEIARGIVETPFLKRGLTYHQDPRGIKMEKLVSPIRIIKRLQANKAVSGDCDDKVLFLSTCLLNRGYEVKVVGAFYDKYNEGPKRVINHTYLEFKSVDSDKWIPLDPSARVGRFGHKPNLVYPVVKFLAKPGMFSAEKVAEIVNKTSLVDGKVNSLIDNNLGEEVWEI